MTKLTVYGKLVKRLAKLPENKFLLVHLTTDNEGNLVHFGFDRDNEVDIEGHPEYPIAEDGDIFDKNQPAV